MPRIREVKHEFFLDEELAQVSHAARLLFIGLWTLCDRAGRLEDRPARIKAQLFPYGADDVDALLSELSEHEGRFIRRYEVDGRRYLEVRSFTKHQRPHPKETPSRYPAPAVENHGKPRKDTASRERVGNQVDPSGGSMGTWAHGHMGSGEVGARENGEDEGPPAYPPTQRAERAVTDNVDKLQLQLGERLARLAEHPNSKLMVPDWSALVTGYDKGDKRVPGRQDFRMIRSPERLQRSIEDADGWWQHMEDGNVVGA